MTKHKLNHDRTFGDGDCPITSSPRVGLASNQAPDAIKSNFPEGIARPALRALVAAGFSSLEQLTSISQEELSALHGMGPRAVSSLRSGLLALGLDFRTSSTPKSELKKRK